MERLSNIAQRLLDADTKKLMKAGFLDGTLRLTEEGKSVMSGILFAHHKIELVQEAEKRIEELKEE